MTFLHPASMVAIPYLAQPMRKEIAVIQWNRANASQMSFR